MRSPETCSEEKTHCRLATIMDTVDYMLGESDFYCRLKLRALSFLVFGKSYSAQLCSQVIILLHQKEEVVFCLPGPFPSAVPASASFLVTPTSLFPPVSPLSLAQALFGGH